MNTKQEKDILKDLFRNMQEEPLPASFRMNVMEQITKEAIKIKKRNERMGLIAVILASLFMVALGIAAFLYMDLPKITIEPIHPSTLHFYLFIGSIVLFLLYLDYRLRRLFHKNK